MAVSQTVDGNEAVASVAFRVNDVICIYPITPASTMGELCDEWSSRGKTNLWGQRPRVVEMQSEAGAAGAMHGALQAGALATTFTASQGLLLMLPNMYKIAGELRPCVIHVAARTVATHALSIFCDHSDVMACRQTGFALLASSGVQQAHDFACIATAAALRSRIPFLHFFDGFRTSHELTRIFSLSDEDLRALIADGAVAGHRRSALSPDHPSIRGTAQNSDVYFQAREASNPFHAACPQILRDEMRRFAERTGRRYELFEYTGHAQAERVVVAMGSAAVTVRETVRELVRRGERVGALGVALFRPFSVVDFVDCLPQTVRSVAVLDRTKEPGSVGEPLFLDVLSALVEGGRSHVRVQGGRYGLSSKEFTPAMVAGVFQMLQHEQRRAHFTVGIVDDVSHESLEIPPDFVLPKQEGYEAMFFGLGSDGTVGANKNTIKILADRGGLAVQGFFVYDSKKAGAVTVSHLRLGGEASNKPYLIDSADFVGCHQFELLERMPVLERLRDQGTLLINSPFPPKSTWSRLSRDTQADIVRKRPRVFVIDGYRVAAEAGLGRHINTVMQACFFALSKLIPLQDALEAMKHAVEKTYADKGTDAIRRNFAAIDAAGAAFEEIVVPMDVDAHAQIRPPAVPATAPTFVQRVTSALLAGHGNLLPVSAFPVDGTWPSGTSQFEKRRLASSVPAWDQELCIQCNKCVLACPHAAIRAKVFPESELSEAPTGFQSMAWKGSDFAGQRYALAVAPEDCTGCRLCVEVCPAKERSTPTHRALEMVPAAPRLDVDRTRFEFFRRIPEVDRRRVHLDVKGSQLLEPLFEFSGACAGCGETPYIKLLTQLFGDRLVMANATGCSSIYGGNLPTTPYTVDHAGRGPAWANSLFEDNAEFGFGIRLGIEAHAQRAAHLLRGLSGTLEPALVEEILNADQSSEAAIHAQRERVAGLRRRLSQLETRASGGLLELCDYLVKKSVWIVGGDGWAYDIGFGGLDHVLASKEKINVLVLDTEVYSNTGGQQSKATPRAAVAKFSASGKDTGKKDLGLQAMSYGHVYVARVAFGAKDAQTVRALLEAENYPGPALVIAYAHCIEHGYDLAFGAHQQKLAVDCGVWPLYRFDPRRLAAGEPPLVLDALPGKATLDEYMHGEARFHGLEQRDPLRYSALLAAARGEVANRLELYQALSRIRLTSESAPKS